MKTNASAWVRSGLAGALIITLMAIPGIACLLAVGQVAAALKVLVSCMVSGAVGGVVHHAALPLCARGRGAAYLYGILVVEAYFLSALACVFLISEFWAPEQMFKEVPAQFVFSLGALLGIPFGIAWGHQEWRKRRKQRAAP